MRPPSIRTTPRTVAAVGGVVYAIGVLSWLFASGVHFSSQDPTTLAFGAGYAAVGMVLTGAVPLYLCSRLSLVTPVLVTLWLLGNTVSQWFYGTHLHPLSSYLTVWPLLLGVAVSAGVAEAVARIGIDRTLDRFGLRPLV
ncbi:hypothetical protein HISP_13120 [Haloarcula hispanica N601]|uniref:Uncharacterized protein n=3 Tax=Haloarcula hispanica TaxID=51589 RepID=V5TQM7_HALHI|nr:MULTISPECIES: hypothetical protein [Haloarcula]AEM58165.1 conserved hypothetical protein [Haloarcula hispanica ATCC 33960]AHB66904.1 hypothetical protein HISP_13120 [Haloarcula hispanica N601]AJF25200.1 hypothetical protein SG26_05390 [Haloarcula sp. CBA1115]KAA9410792.1 hypothetical protein EGO51_13620 [Haloarcula hispanica]KZX47315.1 hypothetical protein AV929_03000 [Haloarcula sp. K1]